MILIAKGRRQINIRSLYPCCAVFIMLSTVLLVRILYYSIMPSIIWAPDSYGYVNFSFRDLLSLNFTSERTPVYPAIIRSCWYVMKKQEGYLKAVVLFQMAASFIAVVYLYKSLRLIEIRKRLAILLTFLYGCNPQIFSWDKVILTESLAISGTVIFIYNIIKYLKDPLAKTGCFLAVFSLILVFHRPTFLLLLFCYFLFLVVYRFYLKRNKDIVNIPLLVSGACILVVMVYSSFYYKAYGLFSITSVMPRQLLYVCAEQGFYQSGSNESLINDISCLLSGDEKPYPSLTEIEELVKKYGLKESQEFAIKCFLKEPVSYLNYLIKTLLNEGMQVFTNGRGEYLDTWERRGYGQVAMFLGSLFSFVTLGHIYIITMINLGGFLIGWFKYKKILWVYLGIGVLLTGIIVTTFTGTNASFTRTMVHVLPFFYLSLSLLIDGIPDIWRGISRLG